MDTTEGAKPVEEKKVEEKKEGAGAEENEDDEDGEEGDSKDPAKKKKKKRSKCYADIDCLKTRRRRLEVKLDQGVLSTLPVHRTTLNIGCLEIGRQRARSPSVKLIPLQFQSLSSSLMANIQKETSLNTPTLTKTGRGQLVLSSEKERGSSLSIMRH